MAKSIAEVLEEHLQNNVQEKRVFYGSDPPPNPKKGDLWYDTDENRLYEYN